MLIILTRHFVQNISTYNYSTIPCCTVFQDTLQLVKLQGLYLGLGRMHMHIVPIRVPYVSVRYNIVQVQVYNCTVPYRTVPGQYRTVPYGTEFVPDPYRTIPVRYGTVPVLVLVVYRKDG